MDLAMCVFVGIYNMQTMEIFIWQYKKKTTEKKNNVYICANISANTTRPYASTYVFDIPSFAFFSFQNFYFAALLSNANDFIFCIVQMVVAVVVFIALSMLDLVGPFIVYIFIYIYCDTPQDRKNRTMN